jgi:multiple sugar transport system substrate-binding protein
MKKAIVFIFALTLIMLAGCEAKQKIEEKKEDIQIRLSYWRLSTEPQGTLLAGIVKTFTEKTGIKVELDATSNVQILEQFTIQSAGDDAADVVVLPFQNLSNFVNMGFVVPLDKYAAADKPFVDGFIGTLNDLTDIGGSKYAISADIASVALYYNKDLATRAGLNAEIPPKNYDEFVNWATKISNLGNDIYGFGLGGTVEASNQSRWECMFWASGASLFSDDGAGVNLDTDKGLAAFNRIIKLHTEKGLTVANPGELNYNTMMTLFQNGQLGMMLQNIGAAAAINLASPNLKYDIAPFIWDDYGMTLEGAVMFISSSSKNPDAAWKLIHYISEYENNMAWAIPLNYLSPLKAAETNKEYISNPIIKTYIEQIIPHAKKLVAPNNNASVWEKFFGQVSEALNGKDALSSAKAAATAMREAMK